ncbi:MAG: DNA ligase [Planctomycetes bacterium]|nr:DNA ligase [Planctomycetota bacterium]
MDIFTARSAKPMLIHGESDPFDSDQYTYELKMDGERSLAYLDADRTELINRRDRRILANFPELSDLHHQANGRCILDGEIIAGIGSKQDFEFIKQRAVTKNVHAIKRLAEQTPCTFVATDILYLGDRDITRLPLVERKALLRDTVADGGAVAVVQTIEEHGVEFFRLVKEQGLEGIIAKRKDSLYHMGKRTRDWEKIKNWDEDLFLVCGFLPSDRANVVSLVLGQWSAGGEIIYKGRVTLGVNRPEFAIVNKQKRAKSFPFPETPPEAAKGAVWLVPKLVCKAGFLCWTVHGRLRQPFFKELVSGVAPEKVIEPA